MKKVFVSQLLIDVESRKELLDQANIPCMIKNQRSSMLAGEVPFAEIFPELWVIHDEDEGRARDILTNWETAQPMESTGWTCPECREMLQKEFTTCWNCGRERSSEEKRGLHPIETFDDNPDLNAFKRYFSQGFLAGFILTLVGIGVYVYLSIDQNFQDRNKDGKDDYKETRIYGFPPQDQWDNNYDGVFEYSCHYDKAGFVKQCVWDRNQDGDVDLIRKYTYGILRSVDFLDVENGTVRKRVHYKLGSKTHEDIDRDGDGVFEKTLHFNEYEDLISPTPS